MSETIRPEPGIKSQRSVPSRAIKRLRSAEPAAGRAEVSSRDIDRADFSPSIETLVSPEPVENARIRQNTSIPGRVRQWNREIMAAAERTGKPPELIAAMIWQESKGDRNAVNASCKGLMQIDVNTFKEVARKYHIKGSIWDPATNIMVGSLYYRDLERRFKSPNLALAAYNAGPGNVKKYGGIPPFKITRKYVPEIMANYNRYKQGFVTA